MSGLIGSFAVLQETVWAARAYAPETISAQTAVGTLPLLAALGIGIVVAVGAVIAFLQLTAKGRQQRETSAWNEPEWPSVPVAEEDGAPSEYTMPLGTVSAEAAPSEPAAEGEPQLCGIQGEFAGACFRINGVGLSIGRDPALCSIVFPLNIGEVSRRHCTLQFVQDRRLFLLEDHGSSNGTFLPGGERLEPGKRYELRSGERFALSGTVHWFEVRE